MEDSSFFLCTFFKSALSLCTFLSYSSCINLYHFWNRKLSEKTAKIASIFRRLFGVSSQLSSAAMVSAKETAQSYIDKNPVMVFSKSYCPYCKATKELLKKKEAQFGFQYKVIELDQMGGKDFSIRPAS
jgi:thiol-disulfide isomerase/thioredoxin